MTKDGNLVLDESTTVLTGNEVPQPARRTRGKIWKDGKLVDDFVDEGNPHGIIKTEGASFRETDDSNREIQSKVNAAGGSATVGIPEDPTKVIIPKGTVEPTAENTQVDTKAINDSFKQQPSKPISTEKGKEVTI